MPEAEGEAGGGGGGGGAGGGGPGGGGGGGGGGRRRWGFGRRLRRRRGCRGGVGRWCGGWGWNRGLRRCWLGLRSGRGRGIGRMELRQDGDRRRIDAGGPGLRLGRAAADTAEQRQQEQDQAPARSAQDVRRGDLWH